MVHAHAREAARDRDGERDREIDRERERERERDRFVSAADRNCSCGVRTGGVGGEYSSRWRRRDRIAVATAYTKSVHARSCVAYVHGGHLIRRLVANIGNKIVGCGYIHVESPTYIVDIIELGQQQLPQHNITVNGVTYSILCGRLSSFAVKCSASSPFLVRHTIYTYEDFR
ncbi:hypothetical protein QTP88_005757 [Uroleucon formosanum]